jgi:hypothetical protein
MTDVEWEIWGQAQKRLPEPHYTQNPNDPGVKRYEDLVGQYALDLLLDKNIKLENLLPRAADDYTKEKEIEDKDQTHKKRMQQLKHNRKLWNYKGKLPNPLPVERLGARQLYSTVTPPKWSNPSIKPFDLELYEQETIYTTEERGEQITYKVTESQLQVPKKKEDLPTRLTEGKTPKEDDESWPEPEYLFEKHAVETVKVTSNQVKIEPIVRKTKDPKEIKYYMSKDERHQRKLAEEYASSRKRQGHYNLRNLDDAYHYDKYL